MRCVKTRRETRTESVGDEIDYEKKTWVMWILEKTLIWGRVILKTLATIKLAFFPSNLLNTCQTLDKVKCFEIDWFKVHIDRRLAWLLCIQIRQLIVTSFCQLKPNSAQNRAVESLKVQSISSPQLKVLGPQITTDLSSSVKNVNIWFEISSAICTGNKSISKGFLSALSLLFDFYNDCSNVLQNIVSYINLL